MARAFSDDDEDVDFADDDDDYDDGDVAVNDVDYGYDGVNNEDDES